MTRNRGRRRMMMMMMMRRRRRRRRRKRRRTISNTRPITTTRATFDYTVWRQLLLPLLTFVQV